MPLRDKTTCQLRHFLRDQSAATSIEYAVIAAGVAAALVSVITSLGTNVSAMWTTVKTAVN